MSSANDADTANSDEVPFADGKAVFESGSSSKAFERAKDFLGSSVCTVIPTRERALRTMEVEFEEACNPISDYLDELCWPTIGEVLEAIDGPSERNIVEFTGFRSTIRDDSKSHRRQCTNEECSNSKFTWLDCDATLDLRRNMPQQMSQWLRDLAARMTEATDEVDLVEDTRNLNRIIAIVGAVPEAIDDEE